MTTTPDTLAKLAADFVPRLMAVVKIYQEQDALGMAVDAELFGAVSRLVAAQALPAAEPEGLTPTRSVSDDMMDLADRLGSEYDRVDPRAWGHLLVYAPRHQETMDEKSRRNARVQEKYDLLMGEGKHGHYETMFRVVREEVERVVSRMSPARQTGFVAPAGKYVPPVLFSPYTGEPRDARDIQSDPQGVLIIPLGADLRAAPQSAQQAAQATAGWVSVPWTPTEDQWGGLARDILMAFDMGSKTPAKLLGHLEMVGREIPQWLRDEGEMKAPDHTISKGTRAVIIYRAMLSALPQPQPQSAQAKGDAA